MTSLKETALQLASQGFPVFPLKRKKKTPVQSGGFKNATTDRETVATLWGQHPLSNIGIACGNGLLVIDLDIKPDQGIDGRESIREWEAAHGSFPDTVTAVTGSGGQHLYFRVHKEYRPKVGILPGVDIRCDGSYVVAPGSIHENGNEYFWDISPEEIPIAEVNDSVLELLDLKDERAEGEGFSMPNSIEKGFRVNTLFRLCASLQSKGLSDEAIQAAVRTENEKRCNPPLTEFELTKEVFPALKRYGKGEFMEAFPIPGDVAPKPEKKKLEVVSAKELLYKKLPPIIFKVADLVADGVTLVAAKSKSGKSWLALQIAICVAKGIPFMGKDVTQCRVLYFDFENGEQLTQDRLRKILKGQEAPENLDIVHSADRLGEGFLEELKDYLENHEDCGMVIIDVLQYVRYLKVKGQTDYDADYKTFADLKSLCTGRSLSIMLLHHTKKASNDLDPFDNVLGSTALMGAADETIILGRQRRSDQTFDMSVTGRTLKGGDFRVLFDKERYEWSMIGDVDEIILTREEYERNPVVKAVKFLLEEQNEWQGSAAELAEVIKREGLDAGFGKPIGETSIGKYINTYEDRLLYFDKIGHKVGRKNTGRYHIFSRFLLPGDEDEDM